MSNESDNAFNSIEGLDFDNPDKSLSPPTDEQERIKEARQSYDFRHDAFIGALYLCGLLFIVWMILIFNWPKADNSEGVGIYYLYGLKLSLCSVILITAVVSTLRFAIRCYGHHQPSSAQIDASSSAIQIAGKTMEEIGKGMQSGSSS